ncbi:PEP-CTERM sorting domain-containing protein [Roseomonas sp. AR75]|uniref:PEP-CTERM sorting domain-containing protein n=1 Tax=Roseomonas sp. AR75 TaxID=2562311 RepID=UPI0010C142D4|nr:PEP-CTERM sorting domain-containing protein [Roseomonas sp. AR75]
MRGVNAVRVIGAALLAATLSAPLQAHAELLWNWSYSGAGIAASGTFTTGETPDGAGFYAITGITGTRNGIAITALQPTGTAIPGNAPFAVDNLVRTTGAQLSTHGIGFAMADGTYANPFFADFLPTPGYLEFRSVPPFSNGVGNGNTELPITFSAAIVETPVPAPAGFGLLLAGIAGLLVARRRD